MGPLAGEELDDLRAAGDELRPVPPPAVGGVGEADPLRVPAAPRVLGGADFLGGRLGGERRQWRSLLHGCVLFFFGSGPLGCTDKYNCSACATTGVQPGGVTPGSG